MRHRRTFGGRVIGVTGSVGKTTVKGMIHHILARHKKGSAAPKSFNNNIGVPLTILAAGEADEYIVCELGSNAPGEIAALTRIADPDIAVITAVGPSHLEKLGSIEGVAAEKAAILAGLEERGGVGVIWADSQPLAQAVRGCRARLIRFGADERADLRLTGWEGNGWSQRFQVDGRAWFTLPLPGRHNASNALAAIAAAMQLGLSLEQAGSALADVAAADMRLQARQAGDVTVINDAYNANPMSMAAAVEALNKVEGGRRVFVAGDMRELGADSQPLHVALGGRIAQSPIGLLVTVGTLGRFIAQGAQAAGSSLTIRSYATAADAAAHVDDWLKAGDTVLVKASRGVAAECIVERILARSAAADKHNGACPPVSLAAPAEASLTAGAGGRRP
jgi:UDP-N-acetylmuramoyl-tripeptide--D-alanyl-D-alanine ligase